MRPAEHVHELGSMSELGAAMDRLQEVMRRLRQPEGCPWDREQTLGSLRPYLIEECYEVLDEMDRVADGGPWSHLKEELGDLLFQIVFHSQLASELEAFTLADVATAIADKIVRRHPHVFASASSPNAAKVLENWAKLKAQERLEKHGHVGSALDGVPTQAPALQRAERLTEKASRVGFDWKSVDGPREKVNEELRELDDAIAKGDAAAIDHELGDVLFAVVNVARHLKTAPEDSLRAANRRFTRRFQWVEQRLEALGVPFGGATPERLDALWEEAKQQEAKAAQSTPDASPT